MAYSVRFASNSAEDIETLVRLRLEFSDANNGPHPESYELRKSCLKDYFERHINVDCFCPIVEVGQTAVAMGALMIYEKPASPSFPNGLVGDVLSVWTEPEYRHKGYARLIMEMIILKAREQGLCPLASPQRLWAGRFMKALALSQRRVKTLKCGSG